MQKAFRRYPIELAACSDLRDKVKEFNSLKTANCTSIIFVKQ